MNHRQDNNSNCLILKMRKNKNAETDHLLLALIKGIETCSMFTFSQYKQLNITLDYLL